MVRRRRFDYSDDLRVSDKNFDRSEDYAADYPLPEFIPFKEYTILDEQWAGANGKLSSKAKSKKKSSA